jgi:hypothetical protein
MGKEQIGRQGPKENPMKQVMIGKIGFVLCATLAGAFTGCVGYVDQPRGGGAYIDSPPAYVQSEVVVQPEYVYYPAYEVYYSSNTRQYVYRQGSSWVSRPEPPRASANVLLTSPSVRLDFHDSPASHHAAVVRQYPKQWAPPAQRQGNKEDHDQTRK